ncbi:MAG: DUF4364 family protein [Clostridia bacterium]|nr:DUF4364 family protein [Clostridia bacterium]
MSAGIRTAEPPVKGAVPGKPGVMDSMQNRYKRKLAAQNGELDGVMSDRTQMKIFILFLLDEMNYPLEYDTLFDIISANGYIGRFDFADCFSELIDLGHIDKIEWEGKTYYRISETGCWVAEELEGSILDSIREKSRKIAMKMLSLHKRGATADCHIQRRDDGKYEVKVSIVEKGKIFMETTLAVSNASEAQRIRLHFDAKPEEVCRGVLAVLSGDVDYYMN